MKTHFHVRDADFENFWELENWPSVHLRTSVPLRKTYWKPILWVKNRKLSMHLRSGVSIKSGHISSEKGGSLPSTQASSSRNPIFNPSPNPRDLETSSESSMSTGPEALVRMPDETGLDFVESKVVILWSDEYLACLRRENSLLSFPLVYLKMFSWKSLFAEEKSLVKILYCIEEGYESLD